MTREQIARAWLAQHDGAHTLPLRTAVRALQAAPGVAVEDTLTAALARARELDAEREAYVSRVAREGRAIRAATMAGPVPRPSYLPAFEFDPAAWIGVEALDA